MSLGNRLLFVLIPSVALVTVGYGYWAVTNQRAMEMEELRREAESFAVAVGAAVERAAAAGGTEEMREVLDAVTSEGPRVGALVYGADGRLRMRTGDVEASQSLSPERLRQRMADSTGRSVERTLNGRTLLSSVRELEGVEDGAFLEILSSETEVEAAQSRTGTQFVIEALLVIGVISAIVLWLVHRLVRRPLERFAEAARRVGRGDLSWRIQEEFRARELRVLAGEFNRMAEKLEETWDSLLTETEERVQLKDRVEEAERVASIGTMAAGVAHQIASPLNVIAGRARRLLSKGVEDPRTERNLTVIRKESRRISKVVRTLLDFARQPEARLRPVDVSRVVREACVEHRTVMTDMHIGLQESLPDEAWAKGDPELLKEVMDILLKNAIDALQEAQEPRRLEVRVDQDEHWVEVEVKDWGPGIPEELEERIFEPFVTTKPGGIGLGLTVARNVVGQLGGELETVPKGGEGDRGRARGEESSGATFRFRLPSSNPPEHQKGDRT